MVLLFVRVDDVLKVVNRAEKSCIFLPGCPDSCEQAPLGDGSDIRATGT